MTDKKVLSIANLKKLANKTEILELEGWTEDAPFVCEVRRSTLRLAITAGKIPNALMGAAQALYEGPTSRAKYSFEEGLEVMELIVKDAMVNPKLSELQEAGINLTEQQFAGIFNYSQRGVKGAKPFLFKPADPANGTDSKPVEDAAE